MTTVAEKIETLPPDLKNRVEGYVDALVQSVNTARQLFIAEFERASKSESISDDAFKAELEAEFGKLDA